MVAWSWTTWLVSAAVVVLSGLVAWAEGNRRRRPGLDMGFVDHGGMWGDLLLLPVANAAIVPWVVPGWWLLVPLAAGALWSVWLHAWWHGGHVHAVRDHMWPDRRRGHWARDLSAAGWCHAAYVAGELALLLAFAWTWTPAPTVLLVTAVLTLHVPLGLLQPAWFARRRVFAWSLNTMAVALALVWAVAAWKWWGS